MSKHSYISARKNGDANQVYTPPDIPIPAVKEVNGLATRLRQLKESLLAKHPDLEGRIKGLHTAYSEGIITFREYLDEMRELQLIYKKGEPDFCPQKKAKKQDL